MVARPIEPQIEFIELEKLGSGSESKARKAFTPRDLELELGVRLRELPGLPEDRAALAAQSEQDHPDPLTDRYALVDKKNDDRVVASFSLRRKQRPHCPDHMVLTNLNLDTDTLDVYGFTAALLFLHQLGPDTYGFFSGCSLEHRSSDFECVRETLPIWNYIAQDGWIPLNKGTVQMGGLRGWFFRAPCLSSSDPRALSLSVWEYLEQKHPTNFDLLLAYSGGWFQCIPVQRKAAKPASFAVLHPSEYGNFGGLELGGLITTVRTKAMIEALMLESPTVRQHRLEAAYSEICFYTISTTPYLDEKERRRPTRRS